MLREWVEISKSEIDSDGKTLKFSRIGYPSDIRFQKDFGLICNNTYDPFSTLDVLKIDVPRHFPYFIVQIREVLLNFQEVVKACYLKFHDKDNKENVDYVSPHLTGSEFVLFNPGDSDSAIQTNIKLPNIDFSFINNTNYRSMIERDYKELEKICSLNVYKSIYIMTGSIIESILLDALLSKSDEAISEYKSISREYDNNCDNILRWNFDRKIKVANKLGIISNQIKMLLFDLKQHRNIVHLGYEIENNILIDATFVNPILSILKNLCEHLSLKNGE